MNYVVLEASNKSAGSWPNYYDSLTLFSLARYSSLPGLRFPGEEDHYPTKSEAVSYLTSYSKHFNLNIKTNGKVSSVIKIGSQFEVITEQGVGYRSKMLISADVCISSKRRIANGCDGKYVPLKTFFPKSG